MKFALAILSTLTQAVMITFGDNCSSEWIWEDWSQKNWRNDCDLEFSEEGDCGRVYFDPIAEEGF